MSQAPVALDRRHKAADDQADLDTQELRELERAEYYADAPPPPAAQAPRGIIDRIKGMFGRAR